MSSLQLLVNGRRYGGWKSVRVTRSIESLAGSFELEVNDRWSGQEVPWPIVEEDACRIEIDGTVVLDGYVDKRRIALSATSRTIGFSGRDRSAALVDCSAMLEQWTFRNATLLDIARKLAEPFGVGVASGLAGTAAAAIAGASLGLVLKPIPKFVVAPGDTPFDAMQRAAAMCGVLLVSDGAGGVLLVRSGSTRAATPLVQGENVLEASGDFDATGRFARYVVLTQTAGSDNASGEATRIRAEATDPGVRRKERVLIIRPDAGVSTDYARARGDWEARLRAAKAAAVSVTVQGWKQPSGGLWPLNALVAVKVPAVGVDGDMLISQVEHSLDDAGEITRLGLVRPDAFLPEPQKAVVKEAGGRWQEIAHGALPETR